MSKIRKVVSYLVNQTPYCSLFGWKFMWAGKDRILDFSRHLKSLVGNVLVFRVGFSLCTNYDFRIFTKKLQLMHIN